MSLVGDHRLRRQTLFPWIFASGIGDGLKFDNTIRQPRDFLLKIRNTEQQPSRQRGRVHPRIHEVLKCEITAVGPDRLYVSSLVALTNAGASLLLLRRAVR